MGYPPIIIIGMHRSGTSMLVRILEELGVFMGAKKEENNEAIFFLRLNEWILRQANATWDNPSNYSFLDEAIKTKISLLIRLYLRSLRRFEFLGIWKSFRYRSIEEIDFLWGWKDPRNTFTIDIWLKIFPAAKILHIYRNPIDVAVSLKKRTVDNLQKFSQYMAMIEGRETLRSIIRKKLGVVINKRIAYSLKTIEVKESFKLWNEYVQRALEVGEKLSDNFMNIKFEDIVLSPEDNIKVIANFIGVSISDDILKKFKDKVDSTRAYSFQFKEMDKDINSYKEIISCELLKKLGYSDL
jgi:hypothetical protein